MTFVKPLPRLRILMNCSALSRRRCRVGLMLILAARAAAFAEGPGLASRLALLSPLPEDGPRAVDANPMGFISLGSRTLFVAQGSGPGGELWSSDGTRAGTEVLLKFPQFSGSLLGRVPGGYLFTSANETASGLALWVTDGTVRGTRQIGPNDVAPVFGYGFAATFGNRVVFAARRGENPPELWASDGTAAGTQPLGTPLLPEIAANGGEIAAVGDRLFIRTLLTFPRQPLQVSDGTRAGTRTIAELDRVLSPLTPAAGKIFFLARSGHRIQVWVSDGTPQGTRPVTHFTDAYAFDRFGGFRATDRGVYFVAREGRQGFDLWFSDGTVRGTRALTSFTNPNPFSPIFRLEQITELGDAVLFAADGDGAGAELWRYDRRRRNLRRLADLCPGPCFGIDHSEPLVNFGESVYFLGSSPETGRELFRTDGEQVELVGETCPGSCGESRRLTRLGDALFLLGRRPGLGEELYEVGAEAPGLRRVTDLPSAAPFDPTPFFDSAGPGWLGRAGGSLLFAANLNRAPFYFDRELWASAGTPESTQLLAVLRPVLTGLAPPALFGSAGERLIFQAVASGSFRIFSSVSGGEPVLEETGFRLCSLGYSCQSPGAAEYFLRDSGSGALNLFRLGSQPGGAVQLTDLPVGALPYSSPVLLAGELFFPIAFNLASPARIELWATDGTPTGTGARVVLPPEAHSAAFFTAWRGRLYFTSGQVGTSSQLLWSTDGTQQGTLRLAPDSGFLAAQVDPRFTPLGDRLYFEIFRPDGREELWSTDGSPGGTQFFHAIDPGYRLRRPSGLTRFGDRLAFFTAESDSELALWTSDGTSEGTRLVRRFRNPQLTASDFNSNPLLAVVGDRLFLVGDDAEHGSELWASDGSPEGTVLVKDLVPGPESAGIRQLTAVGDRVFFAAAHPRLGDELWTSDGSAEGTRLVQDIAPGSASSQPLDLLAMGDRLYFVADDRMTGREVWSLPLSAPSGCQPSPFDLCLGEGRFRAELLLGSLRRRPGEPPQPLDRGLGRALSPNSGTFWLGAPDNPELLLKLLDGRAINGHFWLFANALSDREYNLVLTDTETRTSIRYSQVSGLLRGVADTAAFPLGDGPSALEAESSAEVLAHRSKAPPGYRGSGACQPSSTRLCLQGGRFAAEIEVRGGPAPGPATFAPDGDLAGYSRFYAAENLEGALKILDGRPLNGHYWLFYAGLTTLAHRLTVSDLATGERTIFEFPGGWLPAVAETSALGGD
ncbi:MAG TPA: hypothetical protein PK413_00360 [Thermoanaerobaculia bacterium]|nr:hypothetical protein [Thermoanaerobaculia bacterium]